MERKMRVAAYIRIHGNAQSGDSSQIYQFHYEKMTHTNPEWELCGIYMDEGARSNPANRAELRRLLEDCKNGRIDLIITRNINKFGRNFVDAIQIVRDLYRMKPPVGVFFEDENLNSLEHGTDYTLLLMQLLALAESENKRNSIGCKFDFPKYGSTDSTAVSQPAKEKPMPSNVREMLRAKRKSKNLTQQQTADLAGINIRHYQQFESGGRNLLTASFATAMAVMNVLDISPDAFAGEEKK